MNQKLAEAFAVAAFHARGMAMGLDEVLELIDRSGAFRAGTADTLRKRIEEIRQIAVTVDELAKKVRPV